MGPTEATTMFEDQTRPIAKADHRPSISPAPQFEQDGEPSVTTSRESVESIRPREIATRVTAQRNLKWWDVASLIINKMIGTGIFTGPYQTMQVTQSKGLTMAFWTIGFFYTVLSMWLYLEFARDLPYSGGELIYLDECWKGLRLLAYTLYAFYFVILYTTTTNSLQFSRFVLIAAGANSDEEIDRRLLCFIAFTITCFICLLLYFSSAKSRMMNAATALLKILLLLAAFAAGCRYIAVHGSGGSDWSVMYSDEPDLGWSQGLLLVFFSFHGWENATFVTGEIPKYHVLRNGFIASVLVVGALYVMIAAVFCSAYDPTHGGDFKDYLALFFGGSPAATRAAAVLIALSSVGSMISVAYTAIRVKQIIGWTNILPLSNLWRRTDLSRRIRSLLPRSGNDPWSALVNQAVAVRKGTPEGGVILHFITSVLFICVTQAIDDFNEAVTFFGSVLIYGHFFFEALVSLGFALFFRPGMQGQRGIPDHDWRAPVAPKWFTKNRIGMVALSTVTAGASSFIVALSLAKAPGWWYLAINGGVLLIAAVYWYLFIWNRSGTNEYKWLGLKIERQIHGEHDVNNAWRQCTLCARFPQAHRHREDGYLEYNSVDFVDTDVGVRMETLFGGFDETEERYVRSEVTAPAPVEIPMRQIRKRANTRTVERGEVSSADGSGIGPRDDRSL